MGFTIIMVNLCTHCCAPISTGPTPLPSRVFRIPSQDASALRDAEVRVLMDCFKEEKKSILAQPLFSVLQGGTLRQPKGPEWKSVALAVTWLLSFCEERALEG